MVVWIFKARLPRLEIEMQDRKIGIKKLMQAMVCRKGHYARECPIPRVCDGKYFMEQMLLATKYEAGVHLDEEENDFVLDNAYGDNTFQELNTTVIMMAHIQPTDDKSNVEPTYGVEFISEEEIRGQLLKTQDETLKIKHETDSFKKAFKARGVKYLEEISTLEEKLKSHNRIIFKMSHLLQTIHMLGKKPNKVYDPHLKTGLGYENPDRLKKANEAQPKMYDGEKLESNKLKVELPDYEETLEDAEKSQLKMKDKMIPLNYSKLNALYESFVPQTKISAKKNYFSPPSISNVPPESSSEKSDLPPKKMPKSQLLKLFVNLDNEIKELGKLINIHHRMDENNSFRYDNKGGAYSRGTRDLEIFESIVRKVKEESQNDKLFQNKIDRLLEASLEREVRDCMLVSIVQQKNEMLMIEMEKISNESKDI
ncbi:hypothetical protein Tco_0655572 [Tanacetum coccineum]|uniref:Uncharacterized protein n=1 Tax=Tanacetum coccineum TaxID=301880 RepID=A0ABQ4X6X2_9ASTR